MASLYVGAGLGSLHLMTPSTSPPNSLEYERLGTIKEPITLNLGKIKRLKQKLK